MRANPCRAQSGRSCYGHFMDGSRQRDYAILASHSLIVEKTGFVARIVDENGRLTMKSRSAPSSNPRPTPTIGPQEPGREQWLLWVHALRSRRLDGLVGWFLDAGRPLAFISAQIMYMATPFVGEQAERVGRLLESDDDSSAFSYLLRAEEVVVGEKRKDRGG